MTSYTNDTLPTTAYTNEGSVSLVSWDDLESLWDDANISWNGTGNPFTSDTKPNTSYTNDSI